MKPCIALFLSAAVFGSAALAQDYPSRPVRIVVPNAPGSSIDIMTRTLSARLGESLGQSVVVENRPGASNTIAAELTARAPADGTTLLVATNTGQAIAPHLLKLKFDPLKDLAPIGLVAVMPNVLVVPATAPSFSALDTQFGAGLTAALASADQTSASTALDAVIDTTFLDGGMTRADLKSELWTNGRGAVFGK